MKTSRKNDDFADFSGIEERTGQVPGWGYSEGQIPQPISVV